MAQEKLTDSTNETSFGDIFRTGNIFQIPYFQRQFKWSEKDRKVLIEDIEQILNEEESVHFLGTIILYKKDTPAREANLFEIIDGQQRIITLYLHLLAIVDTYNRKKHFPAAVDYADNMVLKRTELDSNFKVYTSREDRRQLNKIVNKIFNNTGFKKEFGEFQLKLLPDAGPEKGALSRMYGKIYTSMNKYYLRGEEEDGSGIHLLDKIYEIIFNKLRFIEIQLYDASNSSKFFERVNSRGINVSIGDLVRNEVFSRILSEDDKIVYEIYKTSWLPFYESFNGDSLFNEFLFAFTLIHEPSYTKQRVFEFLRTKWKEFDTPEEIINDMKKYQDIYLQLKYSQNSDDKMPKNILGLKSSTYQKIINYVRSGSPTTTLPFFMKLLDELRKEKIGYKDVDEIFLSVDSYLTRRFIMGYEPTGIHAIFKDLFHRVKTLNPENIRKRIENTKTMHWPSDDEFKSALYSRNLHGTRICNYVLYEHNKSLGGDLPKDLYEIEHILPQSLERPEWKKIWTDEKHEECVHKIGNLMIITSGMNKKIGNHYYESKLSHYKKDSQYKVCRDLAEKYSTWKPEDYNKRTDDLIKWALKRWPY